MGITPEMASDWLSTRRWPNNRNISRSITAKYLGDIRQGRWKLTRQGIIFDTEGFLIDGQHRLSALANTPPEDLQAKYGHPWLDMWVYPNEPTDTFDSYDQNFRRVAAHLINEPNSVPLAASARFLASVIDQDPYSFPRFGRLSTAEVLATKDAWPELSRYMSDALTVKNRAWVPTPPHMAVIAQAARTPLGTPEKLNEWFDVLRSGVVSNGNDPRFKLRERFMRDGRTLSLSNFRPVVYSMIVKAWNAHAKGEEISSLAWRSNERIPTVEGYTSATAVAVTKES
jgi:hypothetical protein